ncbi:MAG: PEP-CTERM sorting domain-containing protein [Bryobacteraceae bacterium]
MRPIILSLAAASAIAPLALGAPIVFSAVSPTAAGIQATVDAFRTGLGTLNPPGACSPTPCLSGRREINWDGVPAGFSSPNDFPGGFFNGTAGIDPAGRQRGANFSTPGTALRVSATEFSDETSFGPTQFDVFSAPRLFGTLGSPITDVTFAVPGDPTKAATVNGFGAVFTDVDLTGPTTIEFFTLAGASLGVFTVPGVNEPTGNTDTQGSLSFLGVIFNAGEHVGHVQITAGTHGLDHTFAGDDDAVAMDDFIFGEPIAAVPEPSTFLTGGAALLALAGLRRRRS